MTKLRMKMTCCEQCQQIVEKLIDMDKDLGSYTCDCGGSLTIQWRAESPTPLRASYHDGNNRFENEKEWCALDKERSQAGQDQDVKKFKEIKKEQKKVRSHRTKDQRFNQK